MEKKKGFTLIELLAVLVVLAILALISIPITIRIINSSKENSYKSSITAYGRAVENAVGKYLINNPNAEYSSISLSTLTGNYEVEYTGYSVKCDTLIVNNNGSIELKECRIVDSKNSEKELSDSYNYINKKLSKIPTYKEYHIGDTFTLNGDSYHIISNSSKKADYVIALKDTPLTVGEVETYGVGHINRYTYSSKETVGNNNGYGTIAFYTSETCGYVNNTNLDSCSHNYDLSEVKYVVDAWAEAKFSDELKTVDNYAARLLKHDELYTDLGCNSGCDPTNAWLTNCSNNCTNSPLWICFKLSVYFY